MFLLFREVMAKDIPYLLTNKRLPDLLDKIQSAAVPQRFTFEFLKKLGFGSSNDRAFVSLLKKLGFLDPSAAPTARYSAYRHKAESRRILAEAIRDLYSDIFSLDENAHKSKREHVGGIISRITGQDERQVRLMTSTFMDLCKLADFDAVPTEPESEIDDVPAGEEPLPPTPPAQQISAPHISAPHATNSTISFRHNIEIHLPATTNIAVYNAIFKSLKEHLIE